MSLAPRTFSPPPFLGPLGMDRGVAAADAFDVGSSIYGSGDRQADLSIIELQVFQCQAKEFEVYVKVQDAFATDYDSTEPMDTGPDDNESRIIESLFGGVTNTTGPASVMDTTIDFGRSNSLIATGDQSKYYPVVRVVGTIVFNIDGNDEVLAVSTVPEDTDWTLWGTAQFKDGDGGSWDIDIYIEPYSGTVIFGYTLEEMTIEPQGYISP